MKKILFLILFLTGLFPVFNNNGLYLGCYPSYGQENTYGTGEDGGLVICVANVDRTLVEETDRDFRYMDCYLEFSEAIKDCDEVCQLTIEAKPEDCNGDPGGSAYEDTCGCVGGNTGILDCGATDCAGVAGGDAHYDSCGCIGGTTGIDSCDPEPTVDCAGVEGGTAYMASCGCIGGTTGIESCPTTPPGTCTLVACSTSGYVVDRNLCKCVPGNTSTPNTDGDPCNVMANFGSHVNINSINQCSLQQIKQIVDKLGLTKFYISSSLRSATDQARAMFVNIERYGVAKQKALYGSYGDSVIDAYSVAKAAGMSDNEIKQAMVAKINQVGARNVSNHSGDPNILTVVDIDPSSIPLSKRSAFVNAINQAISNGEVSKFLHPGNSSDPAYHIEIKVKNCNIINCNQ